MSQPLEGYKVLEFAEHVFVPAAGAVLAEWGADVIKIERPEGDALRHLRLNAPDGYDYLFQLCNRNKRGIAVDVESSAGREIFEHLVTGADIFITNHLPRVQRRLGTRPVDIFSINPRIVYARGSGQGQRGPDAEIGGNDGVSYWSRAGMAYMLSEPASEEPIPQRPAIGDLPTGVALAAGILAAVIQAQRSGRGVEVNASLFNGGLWTLGPDIPNASLTGENPPRRGPTRTAPGPLGSRYWTADGRLVVFSMTNELRYWPRVCKALGLECLLDEYPEQEDRLAAGSLLRERFAQVVATFSAEELADRMRHEDCIYAFISSPLDTLSDPAALANGYFLSHPVKTGLRLAAVPVQFDEELPASRRCGPDLGEHSHEILRQLGYTADRIEALVAERTIGPAS